MNRVELKNHAKVVLKNNWSNAVIVALLFMLISGSANFGLSFTLEFFNYSESAKSSINLIFNFVSIILEALFILGYKSYYLKLSRNQEAGIDDLLSKTNMFLVVLVTMILTSIFTTLWTLLLIIPGIIAAISYSQTFYILLDNEGMQAMDAIKESKRIMNGHKMDYFILSLSFTGWIILALFTCGIGFLWLIPYMEVTYSNFYNEIRVS